VRLNWSPVYGAGSYHVKRATASGAPYTIIARNVAWTEYVDATAANGTRFYYVVSWVDGSQESAHSAEVSAQPLPPPGAPRELTAAVTDGGTAVQLDWKQSEGSEVAWNLVYRSVNGGEFTQIAQISAGTSHVDRQVTRGVRCKFPVTAVNSNAQQSPRSIEAALHFN